MDLQITFQEDIVANQHSRTPALCSTWEASNPANVSRLAVPISSHVCPRGLAAVPTLPVRPPGRLVPLPLVAMDSMAFHCHHRLERVPDQALPEASICIILHHCIESTRSPLVLQPSLCTGK